MAGTYSQIYIHIIIAVRFRQALISESWDEDLYKYITGIVRNNGQKMLAINGVADHVHFLIGMKPSCCLSDLVREIKKASNKYIRQNRFTRYPFSWQIGYAAFSHSSSAMHTVVKYINRQKEHHLKRKFLNEYLRFLRSFKVEYNDKYLLEDVLSAKDPPK